MEIDFKIITEMISKSTGIPYDEILKSGRRFPHVISARFLSIYFIRKHFPKGVCTKERIADFFSLNHSMINHAVKQVKNGLETRDELYKRIYDSSHKRIYYYFKKRDTNLNEVIRLACMMPQF